MDSLGGGPNTLFICSLFSPTLIISDTPKICIILCASVSLYISSPVRTHSRGSLATTYLDLPQDLS